MTDRKFCNFGWVFALLPPNNTDYQNFEEMKKKKTKKTHTNKILNKLKKKKKKKTLADIITLNILTINDNHIMYGSRDKVREREFFVILGRFLPFTLLTICKIKIKKKKRKKRLKILLFYLCVP